MTRTRSGVWAYPGMVVELVERGRPGDLARVVVEVEVEVEALELGVGEEEEDVAFVGEDDFVGVVEEGVAGSGNSLGW